MQGHPSCLHDDILLLKKDDERRRRYCQPEKLWHIPHFPGLKPVVCLWDRLHKHFAGHEVSPAAGMGRKHL